MIGAVAERLARAGSVCALTGSGISAESGLPTFRGTHGLWRTHRVEALASPAGFARDPGLVWTWYNERRAAHRLAEPNAGHHALARLERHYAEFTIATQNVDSLHVRAGSRSVLELHGSLREARCNGCGARRPFDGPLDAADIEHACDAVARGRFRPDIVWFGEALPQDTWARAAAAAARADVVLVVGTSGMVNPAAMLATRFPRSDAYVVEVNLEPTAITPYADAHLAGPAASVLPELVETVAALRRS
ncbi:MAG: NAD-dependent protein deacetylase [Vulcanimicrobiaceae bacterium]